MDMVCLEAVHSIAETKQKHKNRQYFGLGNTAHYSSMSMFTCVPGGGGGGANDELPGMGGKSVPGICG